MDEIILDFGEDKIVIPNGFSERTFLLINGMRVVHNGEYYSTGEKTILGLDEYAKEYSEWDNNSDFKSKISLYIKMIKCND